MQTAYLYRVTEITPKMLLKFKVSCILLDIDNTVKPYGDDKPYDGVLQWIEQMQKNGIKLMLFSNNYKNTVEPFAKSVGLPFASFCLKPSPIGFIRARLAFNKPLNEILVVGDQLFTDIFGAKLLHMKTLLVDPVDEEKEAKTVKLRRFLLSGAEKKIKSRGEYTEEE